MDLNRPTYYLWKNEFQTEEEFKKAKEKLGNLGFRVVTFCDGQKNQTIHEGIWAFIQNHIE